MTLETTTSLVQYQLTGTNPPFTVPFKFQQNQDLVVEVVVPVTGETVRLVLGNDYTVTGAGNENGGTVRLVATQPAGRLLCITRDFSFTQNTDLMNAGSFHAETHEDALDRVVMMAQHLQRERTADAFPIWPPGTNGTLPNPAAAHILAWNDSGDALVNVNQTELGTPLMPAGGGDALWLNIWNEFGCATQVVVDDGQNSANAVYDQRVRLIPANKWTPDFIHVLRDDLARTGIRKLVLWYQWFTYTNALGTLAPHVSYSTGQYYWADPDVPTVDCSAIGGVRWNIDGQDGGTPIPVGPNIPVQPGGTTTDVALVQGIREMVARGYEVGICPVAIFYDPTKFWSGDYFVWRGLVTWPDLATFQAWLAGYKLMHRHAMELFAWARAIPWTAYLGSEMRWLSAEAPEDIKSAWYLCLQDLADEWKAAFPGIKTTYSASDHEVGYFEGKYPMDALWTHTGCDYVGWSWYKPLAISHTNDYGVLRAGVFSGERVDYSTDYDSLWPGRLLSTSTAQGKSDVTLTAMDPRKTWQNGPAIIAMAHYSERRAGVLACTTPLPGHNETMCDGLGATRAILQDLGGTAILGRAANAPAGLKHGLEAVPEDTAHFLSCDGTVYAETVLPAVVNYPVTSYRIQARFKHIAAPANWARIFQIRDVADAAICDVFVDITDPNAVGVSLRVVDTAEADHFYPIETVSQASPTITTIDVLVTAASVTVNGTTSAIATPPKMPAASATLTLGAATLAYGFDECEVYTFMLECLSDTPNRKIGGAWHFEDDYAGVRTAWLPGMKPAIASEVGFASMEGSCVEPNVFPEVIRGYEPLPAPAWFTDYSYWYGRGVQDIIGPYGSTYNRDQYHQAICLGAVVDQMKAAGFAHQVIYNLDGRPSGAFAAMNQDGTPYFGDALQFALSHAINGKMAGGKGKQAVVYEVTQPAPEALTGTGATTIYFVRHADTAKDQNENYIRSFTQAGLDQIAALPGKFAGYGAQFDVVIVSPAWRAMNTIRQYLIDTEGKGELWPELNESSWDTVGAEVDPKVEGALVVTLRNEIAFVQRDQGHGTLGENFPWPSRAYGATPAAGLQLAQFVDALIRSRFKGKGVTILVVGHYHTGARVIDLLEGGTSADYNPLAPKYMLSNAKVNIMHEVGDNFRLDVLNEIAIYNGSLVGSNWVHIGDSISTKRYWVGWPKQYEQRGGALEQRMRWTLIENCSDGGRTAHDGTYLGTWLWCMQEAINVDYTNVDIVTLLIGTNDWGGGLPLGLDTDPASKDTYSFYANYRYILEWLHTQKPTLKIVCFAPLQRTYAGMLGSQPHPTTGVTLLEYVDAIKALQAEYAIAGYDIHVIDLYNGNVLTEATEPHPGPYTYTYDGLHPEWDTPGETDCITNPVQAWFETNYP